MSDGRRVSPEQRLAMYCQPCIAAGRAHQVAHKVLPDGRGICIWHLDDRPHPDDIRKKPATPAATPPAVQTSAGQTACIPDGPRTPSSTDCTAAPPTKSSDAATGADHPLPTSEDDNTEEDSMAKEKKAACSRGCGNPTHRGKCKGGGSKKTTKPADGGAKPVRRKARRPSANVPPPAIERTDVASVPVLAIDKWFEGLDDDPKDQILCGLWRELSPDQKARIFAREVGA